jgi:hypothetical protein
VYLYPRITLSAARQIAEQLNGERAAALREQHSSDQTLIDPQRSLFAAVGGTRADTNVLRQCRSHVRALADRLGFPDTPSTIAAQKFDLEAAVVLYEVMHITPAEASSLEVWAHMTCVMMPDIVRWRYHGERTPYERFIGSGRGVRRNTFGRLWWRAYLFRDAQNELDPYWLLRLLGEDDHVQITERPSIAGSDTLARQIVISLHETWKRLKQDGQSPAFTERELLRDTMKRIRRRLSMTAFDLLEPEVRHEVVTDIFMSSASALQKANSGS